MASTSIQTIPEIFTAENRLTRYGWIIMLVLASIGCGIQIWALVQDWIESPVSTRIDYIRSRGPIEYPTLSICHHKERNIDENIALPDMRSGKLTRDYINAVHWGLGIVRDRDAGWTWQIVDKNLDMAYAEAIRKHETIIKAAEAFQAQYGVNCSTFFKYCFNPLNVRVDCCDVFEMHYSMIGVCFSTKKGVLSATRSGNLFATRFEVWIYPELVITNGPNGTATVERRNHRSVVGIMPTLNLDQTPQFPTVDYGNYQETILYKFSKRRRIFRATAKRPCEEKQTLKYFRDFTPNNCEWEKSFFERLNLTCQLPILGLLSNKTEITNPCNLSKPNNLTFFQQKRLRSFSTYDFLYLFAVVLPLQIGKS